MADPISRLIGEQVILDTGTPIIYVGKLIELGEHSFVLEEADMHDFREGHANKEQYLAEVAADGITVNRRQVVVLKSTVISVSKLSDIVSD